MEIQNQSQLFYSQGYLKIKVKETDTLKKLNSILYESDIGNLQEGFFWQTKYKGAEDLKPSPFKMDECFLNFLKENQIEELIESATGRRLQVVHCQVRRSFPGESYMGWHRDTYLRGSRWIGNTPPVVKAIFYPNLRRSPTPRLTVIPGSHRKMIDNYYLDKIMMRLKGVKDIVSDDSELLLFDTSLCHSVKPDTNKEGSIRLIYSFATSDQAKDYKDLPY